MAYKNDYDPNEYYSTLDQTAGSFDWKTSFNNVDNSQMNLTNEQ